MYPKVKYALDKIGAATMLLLLCPLMGAVCLLILCDGRGKPIFRQERTGEGAKPFFLYKFRTMKEICVPFSTEHAVIEANNPEVTAVGKVLRRLKIDELPQLWNIFRGEMSFVGPRPLLNEYDGEYEGWERRKFMLRPGLTGWAQVYGNGCLERKERSYYDLLYGETVSFATDCRIILLTVFVIFLGEKRCLRKPDSVEMELFARKYGS